MGVFDEIPNMKIEQIFPVTILKETQALRNK